MIVNFKLAGLTTLSASAQNAPQSILTDMPDFMPRQFSHAQEIHEIGLGLLGRTLPKAKWTHEAHFAALIYLIRVRPDINFRKELPDIIASYNIATGGANTDTSGYHETLTQFYIIIVTNFLARVPDWDLLTAVNHLIASEEARRQYPLTFWSKETLFSVSARRTWVEPDLKPLSLD